MYEFGWGEKGATLQQTRVIAAKMFDVFREEERSRFIDFTLKSAPVQKCMGWWFTRKVLGGKDTENYPQKIGDCTSFGMKNAGEYLSCADIIKRGDLEEFKPLFPPYLFGAGRKIMGARSKAANDGCYGGALAKAAMTYGFLNSDAQDVPKYDYNTAINFSGPNRDGSWEFEKFTQIGKQHLVQVAAKITTWEELVNGICNAYFATIASGQGFEMSPRSDGFHYPRGSWPHQMSIIGIDNTYKTPYAIILNSWGDVMGRLKDFETGEDLPVGTLRVRADVIVSMMQDECYLISGFNGFPKFEIPANFFNIFGGPGDIWNPFR